MKRTPTKWHGKNHYGGICPSKTVPPVRANGVSNNRISLIQEVFQTGFTVHLNLCWRPFVSWDDLSHWTNFHTCHTTKRPLIWKDLWCERFHFVLESLHIKLAWKYHRSWITFYWHVGQSPDESDSNIRAIPSWHFRVHSAKVLYDLESTEVALLLWVLTSWFALVCVGDGGDSLTIDVRWSSVTGNRWNLSCHLHK